MDFLAAIRPTADYHDSRDPGSDKGFSNRPPLAWSRGARGPANLHLVPREESHRGTPGLRVAIMLPVRENTQDARDRLEMALHDVCPF